MFDVKADKIVKKVEKSKALTNMDLYEYQSFFARTNNGPLRNYYLISEQLDKFDIRNIILETLKETNYKRKDDKWTSNTVAAFIQDVLYLQNSEDKDSVKEVCTRFNVVKNKLNSMVSFFLTLKKDVYNLDRYFTKYDYFLWKYRDKKALQKAIDNKELSDEEKQIYIEINKAYDDAFEESMKRLLYHNLNIEE